MVNGVAQFGDFVLAFHFHTAGIVAVGYGNGRILHRHQRLDHLPGQAAHHEQAQDNRQNTDNNGKNIHTAQEPAETAERFRHQDRAPGVLLIAVRHAHQDNLLLKIRMINLGTHTAAPIDIL